jgi:hypothetical protein
MVNIMQIEQKVSETEQNEVDMQRYEAGEGLRNAEVRREVRIEVRSASWAYAYREGRFLAARYQLQSFLALDFPYHYVYAIGRHIT